jgi:2-(1,2-epoxy-1,2-dihydrophenyl)acetyl-CoA isomerase
VLGDKATLATAYGRVGLVPDGGAPHHLLRLLGVARAKELLLLPDRVVTPEEAVRLGLALESLPREQVLPRAQELARRLAAGSATATRLVKGLLADDGTRNLCDALEAEVAAQRVAISDPDAAEGIRAAVERRPPVFPSSGFKTPPSDGTREDGNVSNGEGGPVPPAGGA